MQSAVSFSQPFLYRETRLTDITTAAADEHVHADELDSVPASDDTEAHDLTSPPDVQEADVQEAVVQEPAAFGG